MIKPCDAVWLYVAAIWSAAALAFFQTSESSAQSVTDFVSGFETNSQLDLDIILAGGDLQSGQDTPVVDARFRFEAEQVRSNGQRFGLRFALAANSGDGRRGFSQIFADGPEQSGQALTGLATGWVAAPQLDPGSGRIEARTAELFLKTSWLEWQLGVGDTAAAGFSESSLTALRLTRADGPVADLSGGGLSHTRLSLSASAPRISIQTRRIVGLSLAASYTPETQRCGVDICRPGATTEVASPDPENLLALAVSFDRRVPSTGVRWRAHAGVEWASVTSPLAQYTDPWIATAGLAREVDGVTLSTSYLASNDGFADGMYTALGFAASIERGDWLYSAELAHGDSEIFTVSGTSGTVGASRWMSDNALFSFGLVSHSAGGFAGVVEGGLRF